MKNTITATIFLTIWIITMVLFGINRNITSDLRGDGGYEPARGIGHPLYQDY